MKKGVKEVEETGEPDDESTFEDWICCPLNPSTLKASTIFGTFLNMATIQCEYVPLISIEMVQGYFINKFWISNRCERDE